MLEAAQRAYVTGKYERVRGVVDAIAGVLRACTLEGGATARAAQRTLDRLATTALTPGAFADLPPQSPGLHRPELTEAIEQMQEPGLLALQHGTCDFRSVCQVAQATFEHFDTCSCQPRFEFALQLLTDGFAAVSQRSLMIMRCIVRMERGEMAQCRFRLHFDIALIVFNIEGSLRSVTHSPDDNGSDFDWVAAQIVNLQMLTIEVVRSQTDSPALRKWVYPVKAAEPPP